MLVDPEQIRRGNDEAAVSDLIIIVEHATELVAQSRFSSQFECKVTGGVAIYLRGRFVREVDPGRVGTRSAIERVQSLLRSTQLRGQCFHRRWSHFQCMTDDAERLPVTILEDRRIRSATATLRTVAVRDRRLIFRQERRNRGKKRIRAKAVAGSMRSASFDSIAPPFDRAINDCCWLAIVKVERETLRRGDLLPIETVRYVNHIPVVQVSQFGWCPLHIFAGRFAVTANPVRVNRRLIPINVQDDVIERRGPGRGQRFGHAPGSHSTFTFYYMYLAVRSRRKDRPRPMPNRTMPEGRRRTHQSRA